MVIQIDSKELSARPSAALVVVAHPDDESMFFGPVIQSLCSRGVRVCLLCFSTGEASCCLQSYICPTTFATPLTDAGMQAMPMGWASSE